MRVCVVLLTPGTVLHRDTRKCPQSLRVGGRVEKIKEKSRRGAVSVYVCVSERVIVIVRGREIN